MTTRRGKRSFGAALLAALLLAASPVAASSPEDAPSSREKTQEKVGSLARQLNAIVEAHGPDSVALQASLLIETLRAGAVAPSEVGVAGADESPFEDFLVFRVLSGIIFDSETTTAEMRLDKVWSTVAVPALDKMESFDFRPGSLELVLGYGVQPFSKAYDFEVDPTLPYELKQQKLRIERSDLEEVLAGKLMVGALLKKCEHDPEEPWLSAADAGSAR